MFHCNCVVILHRFLTNSRITVTISFLAIPPLYAVNHAGTMSFIGQNMSFLMRRYNCSRCDLLNGSANNIIKSCVFNSFDENMYCSAHFLFELIMVRNNRPCLGQ